MNIKTLSYILLISLISACAGSKDAFDFNDAKLLDEIEVSANASRPNYKASATRVVDLLHTTLDLTPIWEKQQLEGIATLQFKPYFYPVKEFKLDAKSFDIKGVHLLVNDSLKTPVGYEYDSLEISITLDKTYTRDEQFTIEIDYVAKPEEIGSSGNSLFGLKKGMYFINADGKDDSKMTQLWTHGEPDYSSCWFPTVDEPNERTSQDIYLNVDSSYVTLSNGLLVSSVLNDDGTRTDHWQQTLDHAPYLFNVAIGKWAKVSETWRGKSVDYYVEKEYEPYAADIFGRTVEMLDFYSDRLGVVFPWDKYAQIVVTDFFSGAMENTSASTFYDGVLATKQELIDANDDEIIAHELFHQWFGDLVTCESWANLPLNEAFATYGEYLWFEHKEGKETADRHLARDIRSYLLEARGKQVDLIRFDHDSPNEMFDRHTYQKGGAILHMLRNYMGDDAFFEGLKLYLTRYAHQPVEVHQLRLALEEVFGEDLNWYFNQWFLNSGHPKLDISYSFDSAGLHVQVDQRASNGSEYVYRLPISIDIYRNGKAERHEVEINRQENRFDFAMQIKPDWVNVDARKILICEKEDNKSIEEWALQYLQGPLFVDGYEALRALKKEQDNVIAQEVFLAALNDPFHALRRMAVADVDLDEKHGKEALQKIEALAGRDPNSRVRAKAIEVLGNEENDEYKKHFIRALNDSSLMVIAAGLEALQGIDEELALSKAEELEHFDNGSVVDAVARVYSLAADSGKQVYFEDKLTKVRSFAKYYTTYHYGNFLCRMLYKTTEKGVATLRDIVEGTSSSFMERAGKESMERIRESAEDRIASNEEKIKATDSFDLRAIENLEDEIDQFNRIIRLVDHTLEELEEPEEE